jgi:protein ImuB
MFACLFGSVSLRELASEFSPLVEVADSKTVVFSIAGLGRFIGGIEEIVSEICRRGAARGIQASLAVAGNPDAAILAAKNLPGVTILVAGEEASALGRIPVTALPAEPELLETLGRWGIRTVGEFAALPADGTTERFGETGSYLRRLALGKVNRALRINAPPAEFEASRELEYPIDSLEPLLFVISAVLHDLMNQIERQALAANGVMLVFNEGKNEVVRNLGLPVAIRDAKVLLKLVQLDLEARPIGQVVHALRVRLNPAEARVRQEGLFIPGTPEPEKLQVLIARLGSLVGKDSVGSPEILDTHRPDAYRIQPCAFECTEPIGGGPVYPVRLSFRCFRPPIPAQVETRGGLPVRVQSREANGNVSRAAGPWRSEGDWWTSSKWHQDEWDVELENGELYRLYTAPVAWFVGGAYD